MKIVHIYMIGPYNDGWQYQENLITKYQSRQGHQVTIMVSEWMFDTDGKIVKTNGETYINQDGVKVIRLSESTLGNS